MHGSGLIFIEYFRNLDSPKKLIQIYRKDIIIYYIKKHSNGTEIDIHSTLKLVFSLKTIFLNSQFIYIFNSFSLQSLNDHSY